MTTTQLHQADRWLTQAEQQWARALPSPDIRRIEFCSSVRKTEDTFVLHATVFVRYTDSTWHQWKFTRALSWNEALTQAGELYRRWQTDLPYWIAGQCLQDGWRRA